MGFGQPFAAHSKHLMMLDTEMANVILRAHRRAAVRARVRATMRAWVLCYDA